MNSESHKKQKEKTVNRMKTITDTDGIRQSSNYDIHNKPLPDNNMFFEERHNPLSSKGN